MSSASFRRVFAADVVSTFGSLMTRLAIPWLAVLILDAGPSAMALLAVADVAAAAGASLVLGALVDRWPKRAAMVASDLLRAAALLAIPLLAWLDQLSIAVLVAVVAFNGALTVLFELAQSAWLARSTVESELAQRNSALAAGNAVTEAASFGLTGWIFQLAGAAVALITDAVTYLVSALLLLRVDEPAPRAAATDAPPAETLRARVRAFGAEVRAGLRALAADPVLRALAQVAALTAFGSSFAATTYMIYVARDVGFPTGTLGLIFALGGFGSLAGAWLTARLSQRIATHTLLVGGLAVWAVGSACAPLATSATLMGIVLLCVQQLVGDAGGLTYYVTDRTLRQSRAPEAFLGRIDASIRTLSNTATLFGALLGGALAELVGARALLFASSAVIGATTIFAALRLRPSSAKTSAAV
jgi:predicted MFS family arabinose efflux permease